MTIIALYGGPPKRDIVQLAFEECGQAGYEFELSPEEYDSALRRLNAMMAEWIEEGICLGYNFPNYGNGSPEDESGIPYGAVQSVATFLARRVAPSIGKTMGPESSSVMARSFALLKSKYNKPRPMQLGRLTPVGSGNRWQGMHGRPFFGYGWWRCNHGTDWCASDATNCGCTRAACLGPDSGASVPCAPGETFIVDG